ncbi:hypothetical protein FB566_2508 [Stackebrandtia endophytica]|uniref:Lipoprotein n=1 Tax=Stackebrandtia endophytica TaxID=1496996 RepID=A0A543AWM9_9ACTN|nr:hypothetical protein [Stackebrandtia endophytica]TQL76964.1 hypothetical protein FB566_2508 [Stackebrandtia endophytica]
MRKTALAGLVALSLAGCAAPVGAFINPGDETQAVVGPALDELSQQPVLGYDGSIPDLAGTGAVAQIDLDVTQDGTAHGTGSVADSEIEIAHLQEALLISGPKGFWSDYVGVDSAYAKKIDGKWTQLDPTLGLNPATVLAPAEYAKVLRYAMEDAQTLDVALPEPEDRDGSQVYPLAVGEGFVYVTVEAPHTVVAVTDVVVELDAGPADLSVTVADAGYVETFQGRFVDAVDGMSTIYDNGVDLAVDESDIEFDCNSSDFSCKLSLKAKGQLSANYHLADRVKFTMKAEVKGGSLGTKKCDDSSTADLGKNAKLSCTVKFTPSVGEYSIEPTWLTTGVATHKPDIEEWSKSLVEEFGTILSTY